jgi:putative (di)nucleoside polyphosphate hydrolase
MYHIMTKNQPPQTKHQSNYDEAYRSSVGMVIFSREGLVLLAERIGSADSWQMPQGGIDEGEDPELAVFREMEEEIGTRNAKIIGQVDEWLYYDFPAHTAQKLFEGKYRGQRQKWIAMRFLGEDSDINLEAHSHPEFSRWKWVPFTELMKYVVPFKRTVYERVMQEFAPYAVKS